MHGHALHFVRGHFCTNRIVYRADVDTHRNIKHELSHNASCDDQGRHSARSDIHLSIDDVFDAASLAILSRIRKPTAIRLIPKVAKPQFHRQLRVPHPRAGSVISTYNRLFVIKYALHVTPPGDVIPHRGECADVQDFAPKWPHQRTRIPHTKKERMTDPTPEYNRTTDSRVRAPAPRHRSPEEPASGGTARARCA